jgi:DNA-binding NarL/FixJ family response regulator
MGGVGDRGPVSGVRILVAHDHALVQWGLRLVLGHQDWVERCVAARREEAVALAARYQPNVALVDLLRVDDAGLEACREIRRAAPAARVLLMAGSRGVPADLAAAAGATCVLGHDAAPAAIARAVHAVASGRACAAPPRSSVRAGGLSQRQREVLGLIASGATNREIAGKLHLSLHTVKQHSSSVYRKLGARNRADAVHRAQQLGLIG